MAGGLMNRMDGEDVLLIPKSDRRVLANVPDNKGQRTHIDRRGNGEESDIWGSQRLGRRYAVNYDVTAQYSVGNKTVKCSCKGIDISSTGMLLEVSPAIAHDLSHAKMITLRFAIVPGSMPEGYEMNVKIEARYIRTADVGDGKAVCGVEFSETLTSYAAKHKNRYMITAAALFMFVIMACVLLMRAESVIYFKFNQYLYAYSIIAAAFLLTRYLFGALYRPVPIDETFTPGVSIVIPCFNEAQWINKTILGCLNQDYPPDKLEVIIVDDCSTDGSAERVAALVEKLKLEEARYGIESRLRFIRMKQNLGKREAMAKGTLLACHELVAFVDSDSFLDPLAIRSLVQPFRDAKMAGVSGRTDVANTYTNGLTKMQAVRYFIAFRVLKAAESYFDAVTCLSGPLSCYRKDLVLRYLEPWLNQQFLGERATFGDDRSLTNFMLKEHRTAYQDTAVCSTIAPNRYSVFLSQQMRWKRSWLRESLIASRFMWKKEPFMALSFYMGVLVPLLAPLVVIYNLVYIPAAHRVFPLTFLIGITLMALLMSMAQLLLRKSSTWVYGLWFVMYYEAVLLWQMPVAWFTFWKSTWGTRLTPADMAAQAKKNGKAEGVK